MNPLTLLPVTWSNTNASSSTDLLRPLPITESSRTSALKRLRLASVSKNTVTFAASSVKKALAFGIIRSAKIQTTPKGVPDLMIQHNGAKENPGHELNMSFIAAIRELDISGLLFRLSIRIFIENSYGKFEMVINYPDAVAIAKSATELAIQHNLITSHSSTEETIALEINRKRGT